MSEARLFSDPAAAAPDSALRDALRLALTPGVGPILRTALLDRFGSATGVFAAAPSDLRSVPGIGPKVSRQIQQAASEVDIDALLERCERHRISVLTPAEAAFPRVLREIPDPPGVLFVQGGFAPQDALAIAIVGSRHATHYGLATAERLAASLSRAGLTIVSGLARGIDGAAHRGALAVGGRTIAILGSGVLNIYPPEHAELAREVVAHGAVVSESPPDAAPLKGTFPQRNRLISGMSLGVIVVEASTGSGALITARLAGEQGREVFAVPGRIDSRMSHGCHRLIRDGAKLIESADDVLDELGPLVQSASRADGTQINHPAELLLNELETAVLAAVRNDPCTIDHVITASGLSAPQVLSTLSVLEMRRLIKRLSGQQVVRV